MTDIVEEMARAMFSHEWKELADDDTFEQHRNYWMKAAQAAYTIVERRIGELTDRAQQAADALYPFIGIIAHAFDEDGRFYWTRDPTQAEAEAAMSAVTAISASLEQRSDQ